MRFFDELQSEKLCTKNVACGQTKVRNSEQHSKTFKYFNVVILVHTITHVDAV